MLDSVRVLDFGWVWAGALPGQMLSFLGAEVVKVESRKRVDYMRLGPPIVGDRPDPEQQPMFHNVNRGKRSLTVNLRHPGAPDLVRELVPHFDVVIENFSPGVLDRLGLGYEALREHRDDLVMLSLSGGGQHGPLRDLRSYASTIAAYSGLDALCGYPGEEPIGIQQSYPDPNASLFGALGVVAALHRRAATGEGDHIDLAQMDAGLAVVGEAMAALDVAGGIPEPLGNEPVGGEVLHGVVQCAGDDAWVVVVAQDREELSTVAVALGLQADATVDVVEEVLARWCAERDHMTAMQELQASGVAAGAVTSAADRFADPHFQERGAFIETEHPVIGWEVVYGEPFRLVGERHESAIRSAPLLGDSNRYVICEILGRTQEELSEMENDELLA